MSTCSDYGVMFAEILDTNIRELVKSGWKRGRNPGAPFVFGENHLRKYVRSALENAHYTVPPGWPTLLVERHVDGDLKGAEKRHGGVDYLMVQSPPVGRLRLADVLATCEVGGPTRPKLLDGSQRKRNWYPKIVADIQKQCWRAHAAPNGKHYVALLVRPRTGSDIRSDLARVIEVMLREVGDAELLESSWREMKGVQDLNLVIFQVLPK